ncbi:winged helix-turn-helix transcriptional regulator [Tabrizicola sp.]|uniref:winged helix-turn-helix transcriptional regulator n=1 Tax=Tabrizicola sp. TaxID=2005166 RepID=UPI003F2CB0DF
MQYAIGCLIFVAMKVRSGCPINLATEVIGDAWSLVILRDVMFGDLRTYRDLQTNSLEGIATNILASRLKKLVSDGLLTMANDPRHKQRSIYSLTEKAIALLPAMIALGAWGRKFLPIEPVYAVRNQVLEEGGQEMQEALMDELRVRHLSASIPLPNPTVTDQLQAAFDHLSRRTKGE